MAVDRIRLPRLLGHRGVAAHAPENTLAGLRTASALGLRWVEVDVRPCDEGHPVLMHDADLSRTTGHPGPVEHTALAELAALDAGRGFGPAHAGEPVPLLLGALRLMVALDLGVNLEIKPAAGRRRALMPAVVEAIERCWPASRPAPLVTSSSRHELEAAARIAPRLPRGLIVGHPDEDWAPLCRRLRAAALVWADEHMDGERIVRIRDAAPGLPLLVHTVNDAERARQLRSWGVHGVFSDDPTRLGGADATAA